jgi:hypothetical protein
MDRKTQEKREMNFAMAVPSMSFAVDMVRWRKDMIGLVALAICMPYGAPVRTKV